MYEIFDKLLKERDITPYRVSKETGVSQSSLSDWKRGRSVPKIDKLKKIANYFNVSVEYLMGEIKENSKEKTTPYQESGLSDVYFSIAKDMQDNGVDPEDIRTMLSLINKNSKEIRKRQRQEHDEI